MQEQTTDQNKILRRNILIAFFFAVILFVLYLAVPGYQWAISEMAIQNKARIDELENRRLNNNLPEITDEVKRFLRISNYWYLSYMREVTPLNAVILLPPQSAVDTIKEMGSIYNAEWVEYFIYPRLCVGEDEKNTKPDLYSKATHVAIVNYWGYDKLQYVPETMEKEAVLPIIKKESKKP